MGTTSYPSVASPSSIAGEPASFDEGAATRNARARGKPIYRIGRGADKDQIVLSADLSSGVEDYRTAAKVAARQTVADGPSRGIVTFARPLSVDELRALEGGGVTIETVEAVTTQEVGSRWSLGSSNGPGLEQWLSEVAAGTGEDLLGIVSAQVVVDATGLARLQSDSRTYVVDLAIEHFGRNSRGAADVVMNDVYWFVAGWID